MRLLTDQEIVELLNSPNPVIRNLPKEDGWDTLGKWSPVQPASVDLHIGTILLPCTTSGRSDGLETDELSLNPGETAVLVTREAFELPNDMAAIAFPPSHISFGGLLMTNPGHIDPGYRGAMRLTVINMARVQQQLKTNMAIVTVLLFRLDQPSKRGYAERVGDAGGGPPTRGQVDKLSRDFLDLRRRARREARSAVIKAGLLGTIAVAIAAGVGSVLSVLPVWNDYKARDRTSAAAAERRADSLATSLTNQIDSLRIEIADVRHGGKTKSK